MMAFSHLRSERRFVTARVVLMAVAYDEINSKLLKARMKTDGHHRSERRIVTA